MDVTCCSQFNDEYFTKISSIIVEDSIDEYLVDPNLSVSEMMNKYDVPMISCREKKEKKDLRCAVCSAKAFGFNFDQISCESCKAFFRRNALKDSNELHCRFSGACQVTVETRRHCSYCRIKKCFAVGMRKEWIRSEEDKKKQRGQSDKNRRRKFSQQIPVLRQAVCPTYPSVLSPLDRTRLNNITHCYDQFTREPSLAVLSIPPKVLQLRVDEFFNRKKPIFVNLISYLKHLPELQTLNVDDQVALIKQNLRLLIPLNYAILRTSNTNFSVPRLQTIGCVNNINLHEMFRSLSDLFIELVIRDPILIKLFLIILFFTTNSITTKSIYDPAQYEQRDHIKQIQSSYVELLWMYMLEKCGEENAIHLFTKMITKYLRVQILIDQIDSIVCVNSDIHKIDSLMQTILHLT